MGCITSICYLYNPKSQQELLDQINEKLNEINSKILGVAALNNQVETVRELLKNYSKCNEIKDKNNKYPYQYAIDNGNREILGLFSHYYEERKAEIERTKGEFADKVGRCNSAKKATTIISVCVNICVPLYVGITSLTAKSKIDILKNSLSSFVFPTFYRNYQYILNSEKGRLDTDNKIIKILLGYEQRKHINGAGVIQDLLNQVENITLGLNEEIKWVENEIRKLNIYNGSVSEEYHDHIKILEGFTDYHQQAIAILSITTSMTLLFDNAVERVHSYYSRKCTSQDKLLQYVEEKLNKISHKINELEMEDRVNRRVEEVLSSIEDRVNRRVEEVLSSIEQRSARVNHNDEDFDTVIQEIRNSMESVEVENVSASKFTEHKRSNERA